MHRVVGLKVWVILALVLATGWGESASEAQLLRSRRQKRCRPAPSKTCCPAPCEPCYCAPRDEQRICVIEELHSSGGYYIYYAHHHENGTECPEYGVFVFGTSEHHDDLPEICWEDCDVVSYRVNTTAGLANAVDATEDLSSLMATSRATKLDEVAGNLTLPDGRKIHARIGVFKVKAPVKIDGVEKEVTEYFGFGFEADDTGRDEIHAQKVTEHLIGATPQKNLYEFNIGTLKCVVLTVK